MKLWGKHWAKPVMALLYKAVHSSTVNSDDQETNGLLVTLVCKTGTNWAKNKQKKTI